MRSLLRAKIRMTWIARILDEPEVSNQLRAADLQWQPYEKWLGGRQRNLPEWTQAILATAKTALRPSGSTFSAFEVYAPWLRRQSPQYFRWVRSDEVPKAPADLVLCRSSALRWGPRSYWLSRLALRGGAVCMDEEFEIEPADVRPLQYGLDLLAQTPTRVQVEMQGGGALITIRSWLPPEERRLLLALAQDRSPVPGRFPLRYLVSDKLFENVHKSLEALGIVVESVR